MALEDQNLAPVDPVVEAPIVETPAPEPADDARSLARAAIDAQRTKEPADPAAHETDEAKAARLRDEAGRFKAAEPGKPAAPAGIEPPAAPNAAAQAPKPPGGFSVASKAAWDTLPESVKADIAKREAEVSAGFKTYEGLSQFAKLAESNGTTLKDALASYNQLENTFTRDPIAGVEAICQRLGVNPRALVTAMANRYGGAQPAPAQNDPNARPQPAPVDPSAIARQVYEQVQQESTLRELNSQVAAFSADPANKYFENVKASMSALIASGQADGLKEAYDAALWLNPDTRALLIAEQNRAPTAGNVAAVANAKAAAKAVSGAPSSGAKPGAAPDPNKGIREIARDALNAQLGRI